MPSKLTQGEEARTCAIYLRISLDREMDGLAIERQCEDCLELVRRRGWSIYKPHPDRPEPGCYYVDQSKSATDKTKKREEYELMESDYKRGLFSAIVCWDLDRLTRQPRQLEDWIDQAEDNDLVLLTVSEAVDLSNENGRLYARMKAAVARAEVDRMGKRRRRALLQHAEKGALPTGPRLYGYNFDGSVNEFEADVVRTVYRRFLEKVAIKTMCRTLSGKPVNDNPVPGLPCTPRPSYALAVERNERRITEGKQPKELPAEQPWTNTSVTAMLRNPRYAGFSFKMTDKDRAKGNNSHTSKVEYILRHENGDYVKGAWEPLVSESDWFAAQEILDDEGRKTSRKGCARRHLGSGLFLCGTCGGKISAHGGEKRHHQTYYCNNIACPRPVYRRKPNVDEYVLEYTRTFLAQPALKDVLAIREDDERIEEVSQRIRDLQARIGRIEDLLIDGEISREKARRRKEEAQAEINVLEQERLKHVSSSSLGAILYTPDPVEAFNAAPLDTKRAVIDSLFTVTLDVHAKSDKNMESIDVRIERKHGD